MKNNYIIYLVLLLITISLPYIQCKFMSIKVNIWDLTNATNPDFEIDNNNSVITGLVKPILGSDRKPIYCCGDRPAPSEQFYVIHNQTTFYSWFHKVEGVNLALQRVLTLESNDSTDPDLYTFESDEFFPIDGDGWDAITPSIFPNGHNYHFCMELHARFTYNPRQIFNFRGDDDVWVFIDNKLVVDLGAPHDIDNGNGAKSLSLNTLSLVSGQDYLFDLFYCERHSIESHILITTSIQLKCGYYDYCGVCDGNGDCCLASRDCDDGDPCTDDFCPLPTNSTVKPDPDGSFRSSCRHIPKKCPSTPCAHYECGRMTGKCERKSVTTCPKSQNACEVVTCKDELGGCTTTKSICTENPMCQTSPGCANNGTCIYNKINCDDGDACTDDMCIAGVGCVHIPKMCNDQDPCTKDSCSAGTCSHTPIAGCTPCSSKGCYKDSCIIGECIPGGVGCTNTTLSCTTDNKCAIPTCSVTKGCDFAPKCPNNDPCVTVSCDPKVGECVVTPMDCNDDNECTIDTCSEGKCVKTLNPCDDQNACTLDSCDTTKGGCQHVPVECPEVNCMDTSCDPKGGCVYTPKVCTSKDFCQTETCDTTFGQCISYPKTCFASDSDCYSATCNNVTSTCDEHKYDPVPFKCQSVAVKAGVAVGAAAIAGIVIGAAAAVGLAAFGGKKGYELWKQNRDARMAVSAQNPLYEPSPNAGTNPLYNTPSS